eukprot:362822-Chlamydomonas_euryale.AAC.36
MFTFGGRAWRQQAGQRDAQVVALRARALAAGRCGGHDTGAAAATVVAAAGAAAAPTAAAAAAAGAAAPATFHATTAAAAAVAGPGTTGNCAARRRTRRCGLPGRSFATNVVLTDTADLDASPREIAAAAHVRPAHAPEADGEGTADVAATAGTRARAGSHTPAPQRLGCGHSGAEAIAADCATAMRHRHRSAHERATRVSQPGTRAGPQERRKQREKRRF